jgi:hypothetical protein
MTEPITDNIIPAIQVSAILTVRGKALEDTAETERNRMLNHAMKDSR